MRSPKTRIPIVLERGQALRTKAILSLALAACALPACLLSGGDAPPALPELPASPPLSDFVQTIPGTTVSFAMVAVPPAGGDASRGDRTPSHAPFWIARTETTWDLFDIYLYGLDESRRGRGGEGAGGGKRGSDADGGSGRDIADAISRPSRPYLPPDRGFGHAGYPAISVTFHAAQEFCRWLSARTERSYRLPTAAEWELACRAGSSAAYAFGDDPADLPAHAWFEANAGDRTHPVGRLEANAWGLVDMHGNAAEWVVAKDGRGITKGGHFRDGPAALRCDAVTRPSRKWNESDPQIPKSRWWLADGPFVGFRVVCEPPSPSPEEPARVRAATERPHAGPE